MTSWLWWPTRSCDILTRHVKNISVNARHYCDAVAFLVGKMSWFWVQGWTFVWRCWSDLSFLGFKPCSTPLDALNTWPIGFVLSQKKIFFHVCGTRLVHLLIRGPSPKKSGLIIIEQHKIWKINFLNVSSIYPEDGDKLTWMLPKHIVHMWGPRGPISSPGGRQQHRPLRRLRELGG